MSSSDWSSDVCSSDMRLVVAHAGPGLGADALQVVDREIRWFGLHQTVAFAWTHSVPEGAGKICRSVQTASIRTSQDWAAIVSNCCVAKAAPTSKGVVARPRRNAKMGSSRSEERRVGKEGGSKWRCGGS